MVSTNTRVRDSGPGALFAVRYNQAARSDYNRAEGVIRGEGEKGPAKGRGDKSGSVSEGQTWQGLEASTQTTFLRVSIKMGFK